MKDNYVFRNGRGIAVLAGKRSGVNRRQEIDRRIQSAKKDFDTVKANHRMLKNRRQIPDRRIISTDTLYRIWLEDKTSAIIVGMVLLISGISFLIMGVTFFPVIGVLIGLLVVAGACAYMFAANRMQ